MFRNRKKINVRQHPRHTKNGLTVVRRHDRNILASNQPIKDKERLYHGTCRECNESYTGSSEYFCNKCYKLYEKRIEFKNKMNELEELANKSRYDPREGNFMSGFSHAEAEQFSLILLKLMKNYDLPMNREDFVNDHSKIQARELLDSVRVNWSTRQQIDDMRAALNTLSPKGGWDKTTDEEILTRCLTRLEREDKEALENKGVIERFKLEKEISDLNRKHDHYIAIKKEMDPEAKEIKRKLTVLKRKKFVLEEKAELESKKVKEAEQKAKEGSS